MNKELDSRLLARMIIVDVVRDALRNKPRLKERLVIEALDTALVGDDPRIMVEVLTALDA